VEEVEAGSAAAPAKKAFNERSSFGPKVRDLAYAQLSSAQLSCSEHWRGYSSERWALARLQLRMLVASGAGSFGLRASPC
jgi:hypothetical protein